MLWNCDGLGKVEFLCCLAGAGGVGSSGALLVGCSCGYAGTVVCFNCRVFATMSSLLVFILGGPGSGLPGVLLRWCHWYVEHSWSCIICAEGTFIL